MKKDTFASRLKIALNERHMKQIDLVNRTKLDKTLVSKYMAGSSEPKQDKLELLAAALGVNEVWLMGYNVSKEPIDDQFEINVVNNDNIIEEVKYKIKLIKEFSEDEKKTLLNMIDFFHTKHKNDSDFRK